MSSDPVARDDGTEASHVAALMSGRILAGLPEAQTASLIEFFRDGNACTGRSSTRTR